MPRSLQSCGGGVTSSGMRIETRRPINDPRSGSKRRQRFPTRGHILPDYIVALEKRNVNGMFPISTIQ